MLVSLIIRKLSPPVRYLASIGVFAMPFLAIPSLFLSLPGLAAICLLPIAADAIANVTVSVLVAARRLLLPRSAVTVSVLQLPRPATKVAEIYR